LFIAAKYNHPIQRSFKTKDNKAILNWPEFEDHRTQDLPETYYDCGCLYWLKTDNFLRSKHIFNDNTGMFVLKSSEAQDIDTNEDWLMAELKYKALRGVER
ncbi:MAG TPA: pseudaminic acid cytidylyltransferase, partial [Bacteroidia bacterium]|nr:pseudaminic acid cytidylyltransferase [Bacteroidia bacterium]